MNRDFASSAKHPPTPYSRPPAFFSYPGASSIPARNFAFGERRLFCITRSFFSLFSSDGDGGLRVCFKLFVSSCLLQFIFLFQVVCLFVGFLFHSFFLFPAADLFYLLSAPADAFPSSLVGARAVVGVGCLRFGLCSFVCWTDLCECRSVDRSIGPQTKEVSEEIPP